eukprot:PhM_4_TR4072/c0_g1_i1/m.94792
MTFIKTQFLVVLCSLLLSICVNFPLLAYGHDVDAHDDDGAIEDDGNDAKSIAFTNWFHNLSTSVNTKLTFRSVPGMGRGVFVSKKSLSKKKKRRIRKHELIIRVPMTHVIHGDVEEAARHRGRDGRAIADALQQQHLSRDSSVVVAVTLCYERFVLGKERSTLFPWIEVLPEQFDATYLWTDGELRALPSSAQSRARRNRDQIINEYRSVVSKSPIWNNNNNNNN